MQFNRNDFLPNNNFTVYALPVEIISFPRKFLIKFDILNNKLIEFENQLVNGDNSNVTAIFYSMEIRIEKKLSKLKNIRNLIFSKEWLEIELSKVKSNKNLLSATILYSASPIESEIYCITKINKTSKQITPLTIPPDVFAQTDPKRACKIIRTCAKNMCITNEMHIMSVGQGQQIRFYSQQKKFFCFDIGFTRKYKSDVFVRNFSHDYQNLDFVVLSHWDEDHYIGAFLSTTTRTIDVEWVAPATIVSRNAKRLVLTIHKRNNNKIVLLDKTYGGMCIKFMSRYAIEFYFHNGPSTDINESGLGILVTTKKSQKILVTGDSDYDNIPQNITNSLNNKLDYLVVPHHGSNTHGAPPTAAKATGVAIISVGENKYNHPTQATENKLNCHKYKIWRTDKKGDYKIQL